MEKSSTTHIILIFNMLVVVVVPWCFIHCFRLQINSHNYGRLKLHREWIGYLELQPRRIVKWQMTRNLKSSLWWVGFYDRICQEPQQPLFSLFSSLISKTVVLRSYIHLGCASPIYVSAYASRVRLFLLEKWRISFFNDSSTDRTVLLPKIMRFVWKKQKNYRFTRKLHRTYNMSRKYTFCL